MSEITQILNPNELDDRAILDCIHAFVAEEHRLRGLAERGEVSEQDSAPQLVEIEANLDSMWDLLRRRREERNSALRTPTARPA